MKRSCLPLLLATMLLLTAGCGSDKPPVPYGWYGAGSKITDEKALGGFGPCGNFPKKCANDFPGTRGQLTLIAYPAEIVDVGQRKAMLVRLVNRTEKVAEFSACDSRLYIVQEALDRTGQWKPLEKFPETFCGNSFHRVFLDVNEYWEFFGVPRDGSCATKLRFRLEPGGEPGIAQPGEGVYSNEYTGRIDPAAFVR
jgi:hypothetical protein